MTSEKTISEVELFLVWFGIFSEKSFSTVQIKTLMEAWHASKTYKGCTRSLEATKNLVNTNIYHNVERKLSAALQPEASLPTINKLVTEARTSIREYLRQNDYKGKF